MIKLDRLNNLYCKLWSLLDSLGKDENVSHMDQRYLERNTIHKDYFMEYQKEYIKNTKVEYGYTLVFRNDPYADLFAQYPGFDAYSHTSVTDSILICPDPSIEYWKNGLNLESSDYISPVFNGIFEDADRNIIVRNHPDVINMDIKPEDIKYYKKFIFDVFAAGYLLFDNVDSKSLHVEIINIITDVFISAFLINQDISYSISKYSNCAAFDQLMSLYRQNQNYQIPIDVFRKHITEIYNFAILKDW